MGLNPFVNNNHIFSLYQIKVARYIIRKNIYWHPASPILYLSCVVCERKASETAVPRHILNDICIYGGLCLNAPTLIIMIIIIIIIWQWYSQRVIFPFCAHHTNNAPLIREYHISLYICVCMCYHLYKSREAYNIRLINSPWCSVVSVCVCGKQKKRNKRKPNIQNAAQKNISFFL